MAAHVIFRNLIRDPLKAEIMNQPVEQSGGIVSLNCGTQSVGPETRRASRTSQRSSRPDELGERHDQAQRR